MAAPLTMTLLELRTAARQRADMVNSQFVTDDELTGYINQSYAELYDLMVQKYGSDYFVADPVTFVTDGTSTRFALPDGTNYSAAPGFYKLLGVDLQIASGSFVTLKQFMMAERNRGTMPSQPAIFGLSDLRYRVSGSKLWLTSGNGEAPSAGQTIQLWYVPRLTPLVADGDTADGVSGWLEYVIVDAAIKMMQKEESDVSVLLAQKAGLVSRIESAAANRDAASPQTVADNSGMSDGGGWPGY